MDRGKDARLLGRVIDRVTGVHTVHDTGVVDGARQPAKTCDGHVDRRLADGGIAHTNSALPPALRIPSITAVP